MSAQLAPIAHHPNPAQAAPLERAEDLPPFIENLCRPGGAVEVRADDAALVAMLDIGSKEVIALWAGDASQNMTLLVARRRVESHGYRVIDTLRATPDVISLCNETNARSVAEGTLEDTEATRAFDDLLAIAYGLGASDMHIQMFRKHAEVRVRVHGELTTIRQLPLGAAESIARAMYSQADVDSRRGKATFNQAEYQDTSISRSVLVKGKTENLKLRWASGPVWPDAFDVALRILNVGQDSRGKTLETLGFEDPQVQALTEALKAPRGVILLCGATGEGKSTTMAALADMWGVRHDGKRMIRTIEDPPEYLIRNARHMPVSRTADGAAEEGFHRALRAAMRMDPDALLLGEVRDSVTADLLEQAVLTGHKVFATVHAGAVFDALWRLEELGTKRERLVGDGFINAIVNQVLVPCLCPRCAVPMAPGAFPADLVQDLKSNLDAPLESVRTRGPGCSECFGGVSGRRVLSSILIPDQELRSLLRAGDETGAIRRWSTGQMASHAAVQARSITRQALDMIGAGLLCPRDAEMKVGVLRLVPHG